MSNAVSTTPGSQVQSASPVSFLNRITKAKMFDHLCLLLLDGSGSMEMPLADGQSKAAATARGAKELMERLQKSSRSSGFHVAVICYSSTTRIRLHPQPVDSLNLAGQDFDPTEGLGELTMIAGALEEAEKMGAAFLASGPANSKLKRAVRIVLMSDGYANDPAETVAAVSRIRTTYPDTMRICTSFLVNENEEDSQLAGEFMASLASVDRDGNPYFQRTSSGAALRNFFEKSSTEE